MFIITLQRNKCIGCNYCTELASNYFYMSKKDGKSILLNSIEKKGFFTLKVFNDDFYKQCKNASQSCPVKIIDIKKI